MGYYSAIKKNVIMLFAATWIDLIIVTLSEINQTGKRNIASYPLYVESKKEMIEMNLYLLNRNRLTDLENKLVAAKEFETDIHTLLYLK